MRLHFYGPVDGPTGYDEVTRSFVTELYIRGHWLTLSRHTTWTADKVKHGLEDILARCEKVNYPVEMDFNVNVCLPDQAYMLPATLNACYTMFEASRIPPFWVDATKNLDLIVVPTEWNRDTFIDSGVSPNKIVVVPLGVNTALYTPDVPPLGIVTDRRRPYSSYRHRFMCIQEVVSRKNILGLIRAWAKAVKLEDNACLLLKLGSHSGDKLGGLKTKIINELSPAEQETVKQTVVIYSRIVPEEFMPSFYNAATHYVTATCGEGWGLPESKAGALGKYLIAPNHSGLSAYVFPETAFVVESKEEDAHQEAPTGRLYAGAKWSRPIEDSLVAQIRASIEAANVGDRSKPDALASRIRSAFSVGASAEQLVTALSAYKRRERVVHYKHWPGFKHFCMYVKSLGQQCGIADYSFSLYKEMSRIHSSVQKRGLGMLAGNDDYALLDLIDRNSLEVVHLQLEYQFITPERLEHLLAELTRRGIKSVVTMHTVHQKCGHFNAVLGRWADKIIVSSHRMRDVLCGLGCDREQVEVISMGCGQSIDRKGPVWDAQRKFVIGFFGFCYFHKGIDLLLLATKIMRNTFGDRVELRIQSVKPQQDAVGAFERFHDLIGLLGLGDVVKWNDQFIPEDQAVEELSQCDLLVLPYKEYGGLGISAAGRTVLRAGVPLVVSDNSFFADLIETGGPQVVESFGQPEELTQYLVKILGQFIAEPVAHAAAVGNFKVRRDAFFKANGWEKVAERHLELYRKLVEG